jgi:hypothetical protein
MPNDFNINFNRTNTELAQFTLLAKIQYAISVASSLTSLLVKISISIIIIGAMLSALTAVLNPQYFKTKIENLNQTYQSETTKTNDDQNQIKRRIQTH